MQYRLLMVDVDGTLAGADGHVSDGVAAAVGAAEAAGVRVGLSTGRTVAACEEYLATLTLRGPHIFFDGSLVLDPVLPAPLLARRIDPAEAREVVAFGRRNALSVELYTHDGYYVAAVTPEVAAHAALQRAIPEVADLDAVLATGAVIKAEFVLASAAGVAAVRDLQARLTDRLRLSWATAPGLPEVTFVNVVDPAVSKGVALLAAAASLGLAPSQVVAVGDGHNDVPMFEVAGLSVAMAGAPLVVRQAATLVTGTVEADGLADFIYRTLLA